MTPVEMQQLWSEVEANQGVGGRRDEAMPSSHRSESPVNQTSAQPIRRPEPLQPPSLTGSSCSNGLPEGSSIVKGAYTCVIELSDMWPLIYLVYYF